MQLSSESFALVARSPEREVLLNFLDVAMVWVIRRAVCRGAQSVKQLPGVYSVGDEACRLLIQILLSQRADALVQAKSPAESFVSVLENTQLAQNEFKKFVWKARERC